MALITKPKALQKQFPSDEAFDRVVAKAADTRAVTKLREGIWKGKKRAISHTITPDLLKRVDEQAAVRGQTRTAIINQAIYDYLMAASSGKGA